MFKKIKVLSGGEKSRVALAKTLISDANFLLLDEPTNHLDIQSVNILIQALQQYEGTFITVSHDRHFIRGVANKIWYIDNHQIKEYPGTYDEYVFWKSQQEEIPAEPKPAKNEKPLPAPKMERTTASEQTKKDLKKKEKDLEELEAKIMGLEEEKAKLESQMADPDFYQDEERSASVNTSYGTLLAQISQLNQHWESLAEEIETLQEILS